MFKIEKQFGEADVAAVDGKNNRNFCMLARGTCGGVHCCLVAEVGTGKLGVHFNASGCVTQGVTLLRKK